MLCCAVLCCAVLCRAVLCCVFGHAVLAGVWRKQQYDVLCYATLRCAMKEDKRIDCVRQAAVHCLILLFRMLSSLLRRYTVLC